MEHSSIFVFFASLITLAQPHKLLQDMLAVLTPLMVLQFCVFHAHDMERLSLRSVLV